MYEQDDLDFIDILYQQWAQTTLAEHGHYEVADRGSDCDPAVRYQVYGVHDAKEYQNYVAGCVSEADADFIAGMHGAIPDLVRRIHELIDENERLDSARDAAEVALAEAYEEIERLSKPKEWDYNPIAMRIPADELEMWRNVPPPPPMYRFDGIRSANDVYKEMQDKLKGSI